MEYAQLASGGSAKSTVKGKSAAMKHLDAFCLTKSLGLNSSGSASSERLTQEELCSEKLFREFATYLTEFAMKLNGELYMSGTATQYLSAAKEMAMKMFPRNAIWEVRLLEKWYPSLRVAVEKKVNRRQIKNGQPIAEASLPIGRSLLRSICEGLMKDEKGSVESMKRRLAMIMTFLAVGRSGEVACSTWTSALWDHDLGNLMMEWKELKAGKISVELQNFGLLTDC